MLLKGPERLWAHLGLEGLGSLAVSQQHPLRAPVESHSPRCCS